MLAAVVAFVLAAQAPTAAAGLIPKRYAQAELFGDEVMEHGDLFSSASYIYFAYKRGFHSPELTMPVCIDGFYLEAVLQSECPLPGESLAACERAAPGDKCVDDGGCSVPDGVGNCPSRSGPISVYRKKTTFCRAGGASDCQSRSKGLFVTATVSFVLSLFASIPWLESSWIQEPGRPGPVLHLLLAMFFSVPVTIPLLVIAYEVPVLNSALIGMGVTAGLSMMCVWGCTCLWMVDNNASQVQNKPAASSTSMNLPLLSLCVAAKMAPEKAEEVMKERAPRKVVLRVVQDVPELICSALDLWWFGESWFAVLDIAFSAAMMLYHLLPPTTRVLYRIFTYTFTAFNNFLNSLASS